MFWHPLPLANVWKSEQCQTNFWPIFSGILHLRKEYKFHNLRGEVDDLSKDIVPDVLKKPHLMGKITAFGGDNTTFGGLAETGSTIIFQNWTYNC
jgi:hypothetical protein